MYLLFMDSILFMFDIEILLLFFDDSIKGLAPFVINNFFLIFSILLSKEYVFNCLSVWHFIITFSFNLGLLVKLKLELVQTL